MLTLSSQISLYHYPQAACRLGNFFVILKKYPCFSGISYPLFTAMIYFLCIFILFPFAGGKKTYSGENNKMLQKYAQDLKKEFAGYNAKGLRPM